MHDRKYGSRPGHRHLSLLLLSAAAVSVLAAGLDAGVLYPQRVAASGAARAFSIVSSPDTSVNQNNDLYGVACPSSTDCWAVGSASTGNGQVILMEQNTGGGWSIVSSPVPSGASLSGLNGIACAGPSDCWAVGVYGISGVQYTLTEQYSGTSWSIVSSPNPSGTVLGLDAVACAAADDCWAVGSYITGGQLGTLIEAYTGSGWSIQPAPALPAGSTSPSLSAVGCVAGVAECWAVGSYTDSGGNPETLIEEDTGSGWSIVSSQTPTPSNNFSVSLSGVTCTATTSCWAVGSYATALAASTDPLIEQYTGGGWTITASAVPAGGTGVQLFAVGCLSSADCWAVGSYMDSGSNPETLTEQYAGSGWSVVSSPTPSGGYEDRLAAEACQVADGVCIAVGYNTGGERCGCGLSGYDQTLIEQTATVNVFPGGGYTVDAYGGIHPYGDAPAEAVTGDFPGFNIIRGVTLNACDPSGHSGWTVDGYGGMHPFGGAPYVSVYGGYYPGFDIIRGAVAWCDQGQAVGYTVDAYGGMHPFSSDPGGIEPPYPQVTGYWPGQQLTAGIVLIPGTDEGYVADAYGGLHPFNGAPYQAVTAYFPGFNIVRGVTLLPGGGGGYTVDAYGGLHAFGSAPYEAVSGYYAGWDIIRGVVASSATGGYTVDAYGGLHPYGTAPYLAVTGDFPGEYIIEGVAFTPT